MFGNDSDFCERLASELRITVLDCDYAKVCSFSTRFHFLNIQLMNRFIDQAPEYPFPHAYTDAADVLRHVIVECGHLYDISRLTIGGFSAGGGLAFAVSQNERLGQKYVKGIVGFYPYLDVENIPGVAPRVRTQPQSYLSSYLSSHHLTVWNDVLIPI
jgi:cephalosporin-C deacetylase-like acetyl esterase